MTVESARTRAGHRRAVSASGSAPLPCSCLHANTHFVRTALTRISRFWRRDPPPGPADSGTGTSTELIFRLRSWPALQPEARTAEVYRLLCILSVQPLTRPWIYKNSPLTQRELDVLITRLVDSGNLEVIDPGSFTRPDL